jgi:hypothetical protein
MEKLTNWDFGDKKINSGTQQVNRQKSALNVEVIEIDKEENAGIFSDKKNGIVTASLKECECKDFNFIGNSPRKSFFPCMHIYRLAMDLGLVEVKHYDYKAKISMMSSDEAKAYYLSQIQKIGRDYTQWGGWDMRVHASLQQKVRQHRAYQILDGDSGNPSKYTTTLESCSCPDFQERNLPCKHIYHSALLRKVELHITRSDYLRNKDRIF